jgi:hypothetical protein
MITTPCTSPVFGPRTPNRLDLMGIRFFAPADDPGAGDPPADPPADPAPKADPPADPSAGDPPPWSAEEYDREKAWKKIQAQRADIDAIRAKAQKDIDEATTAAEKRAAEKAYKEIGKTLGVVTDEADQPTVESLSSALQEKDSSLTSAQAALAATRAENAVLRFAGKHNGDSDALLDSRDFEKKLAGIDSTADDYAAQVEALVQKEIESNARYRKVQVAASNSDGNPHTGDPTPESPSSIDELRKERQKRRGV